MMPSIDQEGVKSTPPEPALSFSFTPDYVSTETEIVLRESELLMDELAANLTPSTATFANLVRPILDDANNRKRRLGFLGLFLSRVSPDSSIREAARKSQKVVTTAQVKTLIRQDIAALVGAVFEKAKVDETLDAEDRYALAKLHGQISRSGASIQDTAKRARFEAAKVEVNDLLAAAQKDFTETDDGVWFTRLELAGTPETWLASLKTEQVGSDGEQRFWVTFSDDHFTNVMRSASHEETRRNLYKMKQRRFPQNISRLSKIVTLRDEIARTLGFENHGALIMEERMAKSAESVKEFLHKLRLTLGPLASAETEALRELKCRDVTRDGHDHQDLASQDTVQFYVWDRMYYSRKQSQEKASIGNTQISEYFEISHTLERMLRVFEGLFGLRFERQQEASVWHPSVTAYAVWDSTEEGGGFLGYLYLDVYARPGKSQQLFHSGIQPEFVDGNGVRYYPASALVCSFTQSTLEKPSLLQHRDVRILFHELGHGIHHLAEQTKYGFGHSGDYGEIPSKLLEHFVWIPEVLTSLAKHYTCLSGATNPRVDADLPRPLADSISSMKLHQKAMGLAAFMQPALFDLMLYTPKDHEEALTMDTTVLWNATKRDMLTYGTDDEDDELSFGQASFSPCFRNTGAGYYAYLLSEIYSMDLYLSAFSKDPLGPEAGMRWRRLVLERGSSQSELDLLEDFLGRKLSTDVMLDLIAQNK